MKRFTLTICGILIGLLAYAQPVFEFEASEHDFGEIQEGTKARQVFKFTNTGDKPLTIMSVKASCGCTTPKWPKEPIMPGETAEIEAVFNSSGRVGRFVKTVSITANTVEPITKLMIKGVVLRAEPAEPNP